MATKPPPQPLSTLPNDDRPPTQEGVNEFGRRCGDRSGSLNPKRPDDPGACLTCVVLDMTPHHYHLGFTISGVKIKWWRWT